MRMTDEGEPSPGEGFRLRVTNEGWYCVILCIRIVCGIIYTRTVGDAGPYDLTTLSTQTSRREKELAEPNLCKFPLSLKPKAICPTAGGWLGSRHCGYWE